MRVAIDAQVVPGGAVGGVEQFITALVNALGKLEDGNEEYLIIVRSDAVRWLEPFLGYNQHLLVSPVPRDSILKTIWGPLRKPLGKIWRRFVPPVPPVVPESKGFYESLGVDVVHFPHQLFVRNRLPTLYNPHDLQHLHYPQFFSTEEIRRREVIYRAGCQEARAIAMPSEWARMDVIDRYAIDRRKIYAIPYGPVTELYDSITEDNFTETVQRFDLPSTFALYPAQTWQHKNHLRLIEAIKLLRDEGLRVNVICTGQKNDFQLVLSKRVYEYGLQTQVRFLGFVDSMVLRSLYHLAQFVIHPSLFEGGGLPILEAFREGAPVTCSAVTSLPEYAGDAALLFDPTLVQDIANAIRRMTTDSELRAMLKTRGTAQVQKFTWERTARTYRALYRKLAGQVLDSQDLELLRANQ
jgi:glycosyltransferase involved in cell wall biosynthesis